LGGMPAFLGCSDTDPHIPLQRVQETTSLLKAMGADVTERIYPNMDHTINDEELELARKLIEQRL
jgi:phospholipase/carboxylesterase